MKNFSRRKRGSVLRIKKRRHELAARATISMPPMVSLWATEGIQARACSGLSDYVQELIRDDHQNRYRHQMQLPLWSGRAHHDQS
jgi:hypothetical protein